MTKLVFVLSLIFTLSNAVLYGSPNKPESTQGYRYSRPSPHYLPPHQQSQTSSYYPHESSTQSSWSSSSFTDGLSFTNHMNSYPPAASASTSNGYNYAQPKPEASSGYNYPQPKPEASSSGYNYAQPKPEASSGYNFSQTKSASSSSGYNYAQPKPEASSSGYNYAQSGSSSLSSSFRPTSGYNYEKPQAAVLKPSSQYLPPFAMSTEMFKPLSTYLPPKPVNNYLPPKPSTSYIPAASSASGGYEYAQPQPSIPIFEAYKPNEGYIYMKPQTNKPTDFFDDFSPSFQHPHENSYSSSFPTNSYLPPKREFETPYY